MGSDPHFYRRRPASCAGAPARLTALAVAAQIRVMFNAYAFVIRSAYLSAIVLAPPFMAENVTQIIRQGSLSFSGLLWFLLFAGLLVVPSLRAWIRVTAREELVPAKRLRSRPVIAVVVACICVLAMLTLAVHIYAKWIFVSPIPEGAWILPFMATTLLYSIALPAGEVLLVGRSEPEYATVR
jgi:hypothetical protein